MKETSVTDACALVSSGTVLVDVREQHEWDAGHAPTALHIPLGELQARAGELPAGPLLLVCKAGGRSAHAADFLESTGRDATNVLGGMDEWVSTGLPIA
jgi:rhodanese-related sulfurtransferase